jgi:hypothetical protein
MLATLGRVIVRYSAADIAKKLCDLADQVERLEA